MTPYEMLRHVASDEPGNFPESITSAVCLALSGDTNEALTTSARDLVFPVGREPVIPAVWPLGPVEPLTKTVAVNFKVKGRTYCVALSPASEQEQGEGGWAHFVYAEQPFPNDAPAAYLLVSGFISGVRRTEFGIGATGTPITSIRAKFGLNEPTDEWTLPKGVRRRPKLRNSRWNLTKEEYDELDHTVAGFVVLAAVASLSIS